MDFPCLHAWPATAREAIDLQKRLAGEVRLDPPPAAEVRRVAGVDVSYEKHGRDLHAAVVLLDASTLQVVEEAACSGRTEFPYIPGLLSFRELPVLLEAFRRLRGRPDAILVDGQGIAHPRRLGIASHLGLWLDLPTVGCAKSRLCGEHPPPGQLRGDQVPLMDKGEQIGVVLTTRNRVKPLFVSPGHRIDLATAAALVLATSRGYRMPEPTRLAHLATNRLRREAGSGIAKCT